MTINTETPAMAMEDQSRTEIPVELFLGLFIDSNLLDIADLIFICSLLVF
jgi:hypothetical protein